MIAEIKTEHPHIVRTEGVCGGRPRIAGTRISVEFIARFEKDGVGVNEILDLYPNLARAAVHDAMSYYYDHQAEIDEEIANTTMEKLAAKYNFEIGENGVVKFRDL